MNPAPEKWYNVMERQEPMCKFKITNTITAPMWHIGDIEAQLKFLCSSEELNLECFKSGFIIKTLSFVARGTRGSEQEARNILSKFEIWAASIRVRRHQHGK